MKHSKIKLYALVALFGAIAPTAALAYTGPGAGVTAIGSLLALLAALLLAIVGFIWYPLKRLLKGKSASTKNAEPAATQ